MQIEVTLFICILSLECFSRICAKLFDITSNGTCRIISTLHSFVVVALSAYYFFVETDDTVSRTACIFSASYMLWDIPQLFIMKYEPLVPLLIHHLFAAVCLFSVAKFQPRGLRFCSLLLITETTVPVNTIKFYLEYKGCTDSVKYVVTRWAMLITWIFARIYLFTYFFQWFLEEWPTLTFDMTLMAFIGPFLLLFNIAGLFKLVLVGFPWRLKKKAS